jgi:hypothetical protein
MDKVIPFNKEKMSMNVKSGTIFSVISFGLLYLIATWPIKKFHDNNFTASFAK